MGVNRGGGVWNEFPQNLEWGTLIQIVSAPEFVMFQNLTNPGYATGSANKQVSTGRWTRVTHSVVHKAGHLVWQTDYARMLVTVDEPWQNFVQVQTLVGKVSKGSIPLFLENYNIVITKCRMMERSLCAKSYSSYLFSVSTELKYPMTDRLTHAIANTANVISYQTPRKFLAIFKTQLRIILRGA